MKQFEPISKRMLLFSMLVAIFIFCFCMAGCGNDSSTNSHQGMTTARVDHSATQLRNGKVLLAGGGSISGGFGPGSRSTELYDPATGVFSAAGNLTVARFSHTATLLPNGKVLIAGGSEDFSAELYDPTTDTSLATGNMTEARQYGQTATLLSNGKVLITGGSGITNGGSALSSAELYDPTTGFFTATGSMNRARSLHTATLLYNGKVLIIGNDFSADLYDPSSGTFTATGNMTTARAAHTATLLPSGKVLVTGGNSNGIALSSAELYDPSTGTFTAATGTMTAARAAHSATLLSSGVVLITGGTGRNIDPILASAELYNPATGAFTAVANMTAARYEHTSTLLSNGKVLLTGGRIVTTAGAGITSPVLSSADLFTPDPGGVAGTFTSQ